MQPNVYVDAAIAGRLGKTRNPELIEQRVNLAGRFLHHREHDPRAGVEVDPELVGMLGVRGLRRPDMKAEAPEVHRPQDVSEVGGDQGTRRGPVGRADYRGLEPVGTGVRDALLEERRPGRPVGKTLEQHRAPTHGTDQRLLNRLVVVDEIKLGLAPLGEVDLARAGDRDVPACGRNQDDVITHRRRA